MKIFVLLVSLAALVLTARGIKNDEISCVRTEVRSSMSNVLSQSNSFFASDVYQLLKDRSTDGGNVVFSPLSLSILLSALNAGSRGETAKEITAALRLTGLSQECVLQSYKEILAILNGKSEDDFSLKSYNAIYVDSTFSILESFQKTLEANFLCDVKNVNFRDSSKTAQVINRQIANATNNKIQNLVKGEELVDTKLLLLNTIYFNAAWRQDFNEKETKKGTFHTLDKREVELDFMHGSLEVLYGRIEELEAEAIAIPYKVTDPNRNLSFIVLLPRNPAEFRQLEQKLRLFDLSSIPEMLKEKRKVALAIPKMSLQSDMDLLNDDILKELGVKSLYGKGAADLCGISQECKDLSVGAFKHRATIDIHERGTEASAATFSTINTRIPPMPFVIDRPFIGFVHDSGTNEMLFILRKVSA